MGGIRFRYDPLNNSAPARTRKDAWRQSQKNRHGILLSQAHILGWIYRHVYYSSCSITSDETSAASYEFKSIDLQQSVLKSDIINILLTSVLFS